jgi:hypothetical protein
MLRNPIFNKGWIILPLFFCLKICGSEKKVWMFVGRRSNRKLGLQRMKLTPNV